jgi:hypothetical protein
MLQNRQLTPSRFTSVDTLSLRTETEPSELFLGPRQDCETCTQEFVYFVGEAVRSRQYKPFVAVVPPRPTAYKAYKPSGLKADTEITTNLL